MALHVESPRRGVNGRSTSSGPLVRESRKVEKTAANFFADSSSWDHSCASGCADKSFSRSVNPPKRPVSEATLSTVTWGNGQKADERQSKRLSTTAGQQERMVFGWAARSPLWAWWASRQEPWEVRRLGVERLEAALYIAHNAAHSVRIHAQGFGDLFVGIPLPPHFQDLTVVFRLRLLTRRSHWSWEIAVSRGSGCP